MKMVQVFLVILLLCATSTTTLAANQADLSKQLMQVIGFDAMLETVRKDSIKMVESQMDGIIGQLRSSMPTMPDATMKEFKVAAQKFSRRITDSWNSTEAAKIYSNALVDGLPEKDMRAAIDHYKTPEGRRELKVISAAMNKMNGYIMASIQKESDAAMKDFLREVTLIAERARNRHE